ncbi:hypothetical protein BACFIN_05694 [Bacteroides finegoldii DSM 17565]|nr:hypothetical protein BACFIN_05694 [Bacteroides finegoldii DSM 17565]
MQGIEQEEEDNPFFRYIGGKLNSVMLYPLSSSTIGEWLCGSAEHRQPF